MTPARFNKETQAFEPHHETKLAHADAKAKVLKPQLKWRHLASGSKMVMTPLFRNLSRALSAVQAATADLWKQVQIDAGVPEVEVVERWLIDDADELAKRVMDMNERTQHNAPMVAHDIEQLFTNIGIEDLKEKISELIDAVWDLKVSDVRREMQVRTRQNGRARTGMTADDIHLIAYAKKLQKDPEWVTTEDLGRQRNSPNKRIIQREELKQWVALAVDHSYVQVGNELLQQSMGIPQGMNASPFLSNLYLFMYELNFMKQFMRPGSGTGVNGNYRKRQFFRRYFQGVVRFQDDRLDLDGTYATKAMYDAETWTDDTGKKWKGIYPKQYLTVTEEATSFDVVTHQDVNVRRVVTTGQDQAKGLQICSACAAAFLQE